MKVLIESLTERQLKAIASDLQSHIEAINLLTQYPDAVTKLLDALKHRKKEENPETIQKVKEAYRNINNISVLLNCEKNGTASLKNLVTNIKEIEANYQKETEKAKTVKEEIALICQRNAEKKPPETVLTYKMEQAPPATEVTTQKHYGLISKH